MAEEKDKDKETLAAVETADAKAKPEVLDLKKGVSEAKVTLAHTQSCMYTKVYPSSPHPRVLMRLGGPVTPGQSPLFLPPLTLKLRHCRRTVPLLSPQRT